MRSALLRTALRPAVSQQRRALSSETLDLVGKTLPEVAKLGTNFTKRFYERMFAKHPDLLNTFNVANQRQGRQQKALFSAVAASATCVLQDGTLPVDLLEGINHKHCALQVLPAQYDVVGAHILGTITDLLAPHQSVLDAWGELYGALAGYCIKREEEIYKEAESLPGGWRGLRDFKVVGKKAESTSSNITRFTFAPSDGKPVSSFKAGQYLTIWMQPESWEYRQPRHYSLIGDVGEGTFSIAVKREEKGLMSKFLHDNTAVGDTVQLSAPFGNFHLEDVQKLWTEETNAPVVFLSAGVGITPMLSMLNSVKSGTQPVERDAIWLHAARNGTEHAFRDYLRGLAKAHPTDLTRRVWYSQPGTDDVCGDDNTSPYHFEGRMDLEQVRPLLPLDNKNTQFYFCGPQKWMEQVGIQLHDLGVKREALHYEVFGPNEEVLPPQ